MNELIKKTTNVPAIDGDPLDNFTARAAVVDVTFVTYKKGIYGKGQGQETVPMGTEFVPNVPETMAGWILWSNGKVAETRMVRVIEQRYPFRHELPDQDKALWPLDASGKPNDPWSETYSLPIKNLASGEEVVFTSSSVGGRAAIGKLVNAWKDAARKGQTGLPVIALGTDSYQHPDYGAVHVPLLEIVRWEDEDSLIDAAASEPPPAGAQPGDLDDEIPF